MRHLLIALTIFVVPGGWIYVFRKSRTARDQIAATRASGEIFAARKLEEANTSRWMWTLVLSVALIWASWSWGIQGIRADSEREIASREWFATYNDRHQAYWNRTCESIFTYDFAEGILYQNGQAYTLNWCYDLWSPPPAPARYTESDSGQPENQAPFAANTVFDAGDGSGQFCTSVTDEDSCFYFDDVFPPPPGDFGYGW